MNLKKKNMIYTDIPTTIYTYNIHSENKHIYFYTNYKKGRKEKPKKKWRRITTTTFMLDNSFGLVLWVCFSRLRRGIQTKMFSTFFKMSDSGTILLRFTIALYKVRKWDKISRTRRRRRKTLDRTCRRRSILPVLG